MLGASHGGVTHFCFCPTDDDEGVMTIGKCAIYPYARISTHNVRLAWGQSANNYELGLGEGQPKSATKPVEVQPLTGINIFKSVVLRKAIVLQPHAYLHAPYFSIAAGAHTTLFVASPNDKLSELNRHPEVDSIEECLVCQKPDEEEDGITLLECEKVRFLPSLVAWVY